MKRIWKGILAASVMSVFFGITSQAAVKQVQVLSPVVKGTYNVGFGKGVSKNLNLKVQVTVTNNSQKTVKYKSSNPSVISVNSKGKLTLKKPGKATITVTSKVNKKAKDKINIKVVDIKKKIKKITPRNKKATINMGEKVSVKGMIKPAKVSLPYLEYSSSDPSIATVNRVGRVQGKKAGTVTITMKSRDGSKKRATAKVTVLPKAVTGIKASKSSITLYKGGAGGSATEQISCEVTPSNATNKAVTYTSNNPAVATVSSAGVVTAAGGGQAVITIKTTDGSNKAATVNVQVYETETLRFDVNKATSPLEMNVNGTIKFSNPKAMQAFMDKLVVDAYEKYDYVFNHFGSDIHITVNGVKCLIQFTPTGMVTTRGGTVVNIFEQINGLTLSTLKLEGAVRPYEFGSLLPILQIVQNNLTTPVLLGNITITSNGVVMNMQNLSFTNKGFVFTESGTVYEVKLVGNSKIEIKGMTNVARAPIYRALLNLGDGLIVK